MSKNHKIYILIGLFCILIITTLAAALPSLAVFLANWKQPEVYRTQPPQDFRQQPAAPPIVIKSTPVKASEFELDSEPGKFEHSINQLLIAKKFAQIDQIAREIRISKKRFINGKWALNRLYDGLATIYATKSEPFETDALWKERIELLKSWKQKFPESATARIALADTYTGYGWFARGSGYINTVSEENLRLLNERVTLAENELFEARSLAEKCPQWYEKKLFLAMATDAPAAEFEALFDEAIDVEPNYYPFYSIKSESLKPKWGGSSQEWQEFLNSIPDILAQHNSDEGNMTYLLVALDSMRDSSVIRDYSIFSKAIMRQGFADVSKKHGIDDILLNDYAYLSILIFDAPSALEAMKKIGDSPNPRVWSKETYYNFKKRLEEGMFSPDDSTASF